MNSSYLHPKWPLPIAPAADHIIERIGPCCLDVNGKSAYLMKGRGAGAWWMIWMAMMMSVGVMGALLIFEIRYFSTWQAMVRNMAFIFCTVSLPSLVAFGLSLLWPIYVWRNQRPLRFCRCARKIYFHYRGRTYVSDWDGVRAYLTVQRGVTASGVPLHDQQVNLEFPDGEGGTLTVLLMAPDRLDIPLTERPAAFWEYLRRYMEEGPAGLPAPTSTIRQGVSLREAFWEHFFWPPFKWPWRWTRPLELVLLPLRVVWFVLWFPTDVLYYHLARRLQVKPFPPELADAAVCACGRHNRWSENGAPAALMGAAVSTLHAEDA